MAEEWCGREGAEYLPPEAWVVLVLRVRWRRCDEGSEGWTGWHCLAMGTGEGTVLEFLAWMTEEVGLREDYVGGVVEKDWLSEAMCYGLCVVDVLKRLVVS